MARHERTAHTLLTCSAQTPCSRNKDRGLTGHCPVEFDVNRIDDGDDWRFLMLTAQQ